MGSFRPARTGTRHIRLGTGVVSLPYHNPLMVADRIAQLDHQTRGRVMFGVGPGQLPSDAHMLGDLTGIPTLVWGSIWIVVALAISFLLFRKVYRDA